MPAKPPLLPTRVERSERARRAIERVQRPAAVVAPGGPRVYTLACEDVHPVVRIAHRIHGALAIGQRVIFDHELVLIVAGAGRIVRQGREEPFAAGDVLVIPPFEPHAIASDARCEHVAVHFDLAPDLPPYGHDPSRRKPYEVRLTGGLLLPRRARCLPGGDVRLAFDALLAAWEASTPTSELAVRTHLTRVLLALLDAPEERGNGLVAGERRNESRVERAVRYVEAHFAEPIDASLLADVAGVSTSQLTRLFHDRAGLTPMAYLRRVRVQQARRLLGDVDLSIKEVAARTGFDDPYHFSKVFRRLDGLPPSLYREALLAGARRQA